MENRTGIVTNSNPFVSRTPVEVKNAVFVFVTEALRYHCMGNVYDNGNGNEWKKKEFPKLHKICIK